MCQKIHNMDNSTEFNRTWSFAKKNKRTFVLKKTWQRRSLKVFTQVKDFVEKHSTHPRSKNKQKPIKVVK